ncbi:LCP family protein [Streptomyces sp. N35]|uniref:LCP family protein n=1 Tax=Streptomyces sp. N35 TaxID=2795730 RepID=UPI0018F49BB9|nr:LCP family protein [Streptomyces sp. N35]
MPASSRRSRLLRRTGYVCGGLLVLAVLAGGLLYARLDSNIRTDEATARALRADHGSRPAKAGKAQNILLLGTDSQAGWGSTRADTTMLLHLSADRRSASMTSIPRDLMVDIPACLTAEGNRTSAEYAQFNWAYERAGASCTIRTFEKLSGIRVDHHLVVDFSGFMKVTDAVGGVEVDVPATVHESVDDPDYGVTLRPGRQLLSGREALVFVRTRLGVSDGSDLQRIERQKQFMRDLSRKVIDAGTLTSPTRLYPVLDAVTSSLTADDGMDSPAELYSLLSGARSLPPHAIRTVTLPATEHPDYVGRYEPVEDEARALFKALREDKPLPRHLYNAYDKDGQRDRPYFEKS